MLNLFDYEDYRQYLGDFFEGKKEQNPSYSWQVFSDKAGFGNKSFVRRVIKKERSLSKTSAYKISQAIGHSKKEAEYFENLIFYNQAENLKERDHYYDMLLAVKNSGQG